MIEDASGQITVNVDASDISSLMDSGTTKVRLVDGPITVMARCEDSFQVEVVADE